MSKSLKFLFLLLLFNGAGQASTFIPTSVEERINYSDGLVGGTYIGNSVKKLPNGQVVTELSFSVEKFAGISPNSIVNKNNFKVLIPGGAWNGNVHKVSGSPTFERGEKAVLMVKKGPYGFIMPDLSFSKFNYKTVDGKTYLVSPVFSDKRGVGIISLDKFQAISSDHFGRGLTAFSVDKFIDRPTSEVVIKKGRRVHTRAPASEAPEENEGNMTFLWLILGLGGLGFFSTKLNKAGKGK